MSRIAVVQEMICRKHDLILERIWRSKARFYPYLLRVHLDPSSNTNLILLMQELAFNFDAPRFFNIGIET